MKMTVRVRAAGWTVLGIMLVGAMAARAEQVELLTYYPSPATTTDDLKVKRATVGTTYQTLNFNDPLRPVADGTLLVERNLGVGLVSGAAPTFSAAPNTQTTGNLSVNDLFLRSVNAWASEAMAEGLAPTPPLKVYLNVSGTSIWSHQANRWIRSYPDAAYDVYAALQLWRHGVARSALVIEEWQPLDVSSSSHTTRVAYTGKQYRVFLPSSSPKDVFIKAPAIWNGVVMTEGQTFDLNGTDTLDVADAYEITVDW